MNKLVAKAKSALAAKSGEAYIDTGVKILIAIVIGVIVFVAAKTIVEKIIHNTETKSDSIMDLA